MSNLIDQRRAVTEQLVHQVIHEATAKILSEDGFSSLTMSRVAAEADVSKGTLYNYFPDKDALVIETLERLYGGFWERIESLFQKEAEIAETLVAVFQLIFEEITQTPALGHLLRENGGSPLIQSHLREKEQDIQHRFTAYFSREDILCQLSPCCRADTAMTARHIIRVLDGIVDERVRHPGDCPSIDQELETLKHFILTPLLTPSSGAPDNA
ncbi:MAG: TetR/AcrR family transcriptional regulator [Lentisphaeria bacterium]|nr:TetR/AcrR family transcriptional regulator [Lentisphaeria bacterium]